MMRNETYIWDMNRQTPLPASHKSMLDSRTCSQKVVHIVQVPVAVVKFLHQPPAICKPDLDVCGRFCLID